MPRLHLAIAGGLLSFALISAVAAVAGAAVVVIASWSALGVCYVAFLSVEFIAAHIVNRMDPAPRAQCPEVIRALGAEVLRGPLVFGWRQPFRREALPDTLCAGRGRGVLLVHGFGCNRAFWIPWLRALRVAGVPHVALNLEPAFASIDDYIDGLHEAVRRLEDVTGGSPLLIAHSMGGLAVRAWAARVRASPQVMTIGTPHYGTALARWAFGVSGRQMRLGSEWLAALQASELALRGSAAWERFTCFYSHCDNIVFPASSACLPGADNRLIRAAGHVDLAFSPEVIAAAQEMLARP